MINYNKLMNNLETLKLDKMVTFLPNYLESIKEQDISIVDVLYKLTEEEIIYRDEKASKIQVTVAAFPFEKEIKDFDFSYQPGINKQQILDLETLMFDSTIFVFGMYLMARYFRTMESKVKALVLVLLLGGFVFGLGSLNTGTAMRHRNKFTSLVLVSGISVIDKNKKVGDNIENFIMDILYKF